ncbi:MAG: SusC/RagA family TonB-linked outer membrane protein [Chitinophagaceae bacterium]|nr:SusC/RagA family TonB-linked outer membrane protein [Chitinophagaceae bacterium]
MKIPTSGGYSAIPDPAIILRKWAFIMKLSCLVFFLMVMGTQLLVARSAHAQDLDEMKVSVGLNGHSLRNAFLQIERQTSYKFAYVESQVTFTKELKIPKRVRTLAKTLDLLLSGTDLMYQVKNKTIIVSVRHSEAGNDHFVEADVVEAGQQRFSVSGKVTDNDGAPVATVSVVEKNTNNGTVTRADGTFSLTVSDDNAVIVFSMVGYKTQEIALAGRSRLDVTLASETHDLSTVVVTAMGIKREKRSLGYSVGNINGEELNETPQTNVLNAMAGKVAGVQISRMTGSAGSSVKVIIRGATSLNSDNQPLFVIDGVPVANQLNNGFGNADMGNAISDMNPDDIENISILKGPSAAALYGSRAGNGVVLITTKTGRGAKKGLGVSVNTALTFDVPYKYVPVQNKFGSGKSGAHVFEEGENESWGAALDAGEKWVQWNSNGEAVPLVSYPDRFKDFFQTGLTNANNIGVSGNYEKGSFYLSAGNVVGKDIIPNTDLKRTTITLNTMYRLTGRLRVSANFNITQSGSNNRPIIDGGRTDPVRSLYEEGAQVNINDLRDYWLPGQEGIAQRKYKLKQNNPWFVAYENPTGFNRDRTVGKIQLDYDITRELGLMLRYTRDGYEERREAKIAYDNYDQQKGGYEINDIFREESNMDAMLTYKKTIANDWSLNTYAGVNRLEQKSRSIDNNAGQLVVPGLYTISNGVPGTVTYSSYHSLKQLYGIYGMASVGYKNLVYLDITARNDWSSTLPRSNRSYFYPSASLSLILSDIMTMPEWIGFTKLRVGSAQVGNDVSPYSLIQTFSTASDWGPAKRMYMAGLLKNANLKPEISTSHEAGIEMQFLNNRIGIDATYYITQNKNQVLSIGLPIESGASSKLINAGLVEGRGWDIRLTTVPIATENFRWEMNFNFSRNRTTIKKLAEGIKYFPFVSYSGAEVRTYEGGQIGDMYMLPMLVVKDASSPYYGYPIVDNAGRYQTDNDVNNMVKIGNFNHDFMLGIQPSLTYKAFTLYANIDWRQGGSFYSNSMMFLGNNGQLEETLTGVPYDKSKSLPDQIKADPEAFLGHWVGGRNAEYNGLPWTGTQADIRVQDASFEPGVYETMVNGQVTYVENLGGPDTKWLDPFTAYRYSTRPFPDRNTYSATYVKLRELALAYRLPGSFVKSMKLQGASLSFVASNIFQWNAAGIAIDPERAFRQNGNVWVQGVEYYSMMPWTASLGFKLNVDF